MKQKSLYPLKFKPILKHYLWGGHNLSRLFPQKIGVSEPVAESWEVSDLGEDISVVANGALAGRSLRELLQSQGEAILGKEIFAQTKGEFPLLIKFIDAEDQLSIQVHPDEAYAQQHEDGAHGKTEMWYLLETGPGAKLYCGFQPGVTKEEFLEAEKTQNYEPLLQSYQTQPGDVYYIPSGTIHSIGKGNILFEVQVSSNVTYRLYDWGRVDKKTGQPRETHLEKSNDVIAFSQEEALKRTPQLIEKSDHLVREQQIDCPFFKVEKWELNHALELNAAQDSFQILCILKGEGELVGSGYKELFQPGDVYLVPASIKDLTLRPKDEKISLLNITL